jgi:hypothetical protein
MRTHGLFGILIASSNVSLPRQILAFILIGAVLCYTFTFEFRTSVGKL